MYNLDFVKYGLLLTIVLFLNTMPNKEINSMNKKNLFIQQWNNNECFVDLHNNFKVNKKY